MGQELPTGVIDGRRAFTEALRIPLLALGDASTRELWLIDDGFEAWPLDEPAVLDAMSQWHRAAGRQVHMIGADFDAVARRHPRFANWRRSRVHGFDAWQPLEADRSELGAVLLAGDHAVELLDREHWRARIQLSPAALRALAENAASLLRRCESAWPVTTLGL